MKKLHLAGRQHTVLVALFDGKDSMKATASSTHVGETTLVFPGGVNLVVGSLGVQNNTKVTVTYIRESDEFATEADVKTPEPTQTTKTGCFIKVKATDGKRG